MADILFVNNASSVLAASINNLDVVIQVGSGDGALFPSPSGPQYFVATLEDDAGNIEVVQCTSRTGDLLTVVRGFDNTVAQSFAMNTTRVELRLQAVVVEAFIQRNGDIMEGPLDMDGNDLLDAVIDGPNTQMIAGEIVGVPLRGDAGDSSNEVVVPSGGGRATAGGAEIRVAGDDLTGDVASATESAEGIAEIADQTEMDAQTDDTRFVTPLKFKDTVAQQAIWGTIRTANQAAVDAGTNNNRAITPDVFDGAAQLAQATTSDLGRVIKATQLEVDTGTDPDKYVTPETLANNPAVGGAGVIYHGWVPANALGEIVPAGWSVSKPGVGIYTVTHNLGLSPITDLIIQLTATGNPPTVSPPQTNQFIVATVINQSANSFQVTIGFPDMGTIGGAEHEDRDWYFTCFDLT
jgi:hypothetical protein